MLQAAFGQFKRGSLVHGFAIAAQSIPTQIARRWRRYVKNSIKRETFNES